MSIRTAAATVLLSAACNSSPSLQPTPGAEGFDGALASWRTDSTGGQGPSATWGTVPDVRAISAPNVVALQATNHGAVDQGGGPVWRVQDANNYYLCRLNPLESNFRVYAAKDGGRRQLGTALVPAAAGSWCRLEATSLGDHIVCAVDGKPLLDVRNATIPQAGGHGLWTKADACTSFDDLVVEPKQ